MSSGTDSSSSKGLVVSTGDPSSCLSANASPGSERDRPIHAAIKLQRKDVQVLELDRIKMYERPCFREECRKTRMMLSPRPTFSPVAELAGEFHSRLLHHPRAGSFA